MKTQYRVTVEGDETASIILEKTIQDALDGTHQVKVAPMLSIHTAMQVADMASNATFPPTNPVVLAAALYTIALENGWCQELRDILKWMRECAPEETPHAESG